MRTMRKSLHKLVFMVWIALLLAVAAIVLLGASFLGASDYEQPIKQSWMGSFFEPQTVQAAELEPDQEPAILHLFAGCRDSAQFIYEGVLPDALGTVLLPGEIGRDPIPNTLNWYLINALQSVYKKNYWEYSGNASFKLSDFGINPATDWIMIFGQGYYDFKVYHWRKVNYLCNHHEVYLPAVSFLTFR